MNFDVCTNFHCCDCSCKVVTAFLESSDFKVRELAKMELQPLIDSGSLKIPEAKQLPKEV